MNNNKLNNNVNELMVKTIPNIYINTADNQWEGCLDSSGNHTTDASKCADSDLNYYKAFGINKILSSNIDKKGSITGWVKPTEIPSVVNMDALPQSLDQVQTSRRNEENQYAKEICIQREPVDSTETKWINLLNEKNFETGEPLFEYCIKEKEDGSCDPSNKEYAKVVSSNISPQDTCSTKLDNKWWESRGFNIPINCMSGVGNSKSSLANYDWYDNNQRKFGYLNIDKVKVDGSKVMYSFPNGISSPIGSIDAGSKYYGGTSDNYEVGKSMIDNCGLKNIHTNVNFECNNVGDWKKCVDHCFNMNKNSIESGLGKSCTGVTIVEPNAGLNTKREICPSGSPAHYDIGGCCVMRT